MLPLSVMLNCKLWTTVAMSIVGAQGFNLSFHQTGMTNSFNAQMRKGTKGVYTGGKGIIVRTPDFFSGGGNVVVPGTFWVNDIQAPNQVYPSSDEVWCPHGESDGFTEIVGKKCKFPWGPWANAVVGAVIAKDGGGMQKIFKDYETKTGVGDLQDPHWGWGVFYATDANAGDLRCRNLASRNGWDCPGYWLDRSGNAKPDSNSKGAGMYQPGNPFAGGGGGGAGCHFDPNAKKIDQQDASGSLNLVEDDDCQCNYKFNDNWSHWVGTWIDQTKQKKGFEWRNWLAGGNGNAPQWGIDSAICWVNNPRDMIKMQNALYQMRDRWLNSKAPEAGSSKFPYYWGWNEVPVAAAVVDDPQYWDAVMIKLPATLTSVAQLGDDGDGAQLQLEWDLNTWVKNGKLLAGRKYIGKRPGSYIVFVRETCDHSYSSCERYFYCENWVSPQKWYKSVFSPPGSAFKFGACYLDDIEFTV